VCLRQTAANLRSKHLTTGCTVYVAGVLDAQTGHAYLERGHLHVHVRPEVPGDPSGQVGELDAANQVAAASAPSRRCRSTILSTWLLSAI